VKGSFAEVLLLVKGYTSKESHRRLSGVEFSDVHLNLCPDAKMPRAHDHASTNKIPLHSLPLGSP
jgi:hypothetical protein